MNISLLRVDTALFRCTKIAPSLKGNERLYYFTPRQSKDFISTIYDFCTKSHYAFVLFTGGVDKMWKTSQGIFFLCETFYVFLCLQTKIDLWQQLDNPEKQRRTL